MRTLILLVLFTFPVLRAHAALEDEHGCGDTEPKAAATDVCRLYEKLDPYKEPLVAIEARRCLAFYESAFRLRSVICSYATELKTYTKAKVAGESAKDVSAQTSAYEADAKMNMDLSGIHKKYAKLVIRWQTQLYNQYRDYVKALVRVRDEVPVRVFSESNCRISPASNAKMPSVIMRAENGMMHAAAHETANTLFSLSVSARNYADARAKYFEVLAERARKLKGNLAGTGSVTPGESFQEPPTEIQYMSVLPEDVQPPEEIQLIIDHVVKIAKRYGKAPEDLAEGAGEVAKFLGALAKGIWDGDIGFVELFKIGGRMVIAAGHNHSQRIHALALWSPHYLQEHPKATSKEVSDAFCEKYHQNAGSKDDDE
jgi:hypothetical protein